MNQPISLLLVDADSHGLETLTYAFERDGCRVTRTSELGRAIPLASSAGPQLAVVMLRPPEEAALEIIRGLRGAGGRDFPVVALGPATFKEQALAAGAADYLRTPTFIRDVVNVGRLTMTAGRAAANKSDEASHLAEYHGLFYLLRAMSATERSGIVGLTRKGRRAELRVHEGTVVAAGVSSLQSLPALHHVLLWEDAALSLNLVPTPKRSQFPFTAQELLDECERFLRDFAHAAQDLGAPDTLFVPAGEGLGKTPSAALQPLVPLLRMFDGRRVLADVIEESPFRIFDTVRMIRRLRDAGALATRTASASNRRGERRQPSAPQSMLGQWAMVPDQRGVVGDRRSASRPLRPMAAVPAKGAPIPLVHRKTPAAGEIPSVKRRLTPARALDLSTAPTVQVKLDAHGVPIGAPSALVGGAANDPVTPPPIRQPTAPVAATPAFSDADAFPATPPPAVVSPAAAAPPSVVAPTTTSQPSAFPAPSPPGPELAVSAAPDVARLPDLVPSPSASPVAVEASLASPAAAAEPARPRTD